MRILVPLDKSRRDGIALPYAARIAKALAGTLLLAHVVPLTRSLIPSAMREAEAYVAAVEAGYREDGLEVESLVRRGHVASVIVELATILRADLILMVTRGRHGLGKFVLGSTADHVLSSCHQPVLLLSEANGTATSSDPGDPESVYLAGVQSSYLAAVIWHREARGLCTKEDSERELLRLASSGLDGELMLEAYQSQGQHDVLFDWLDFELQKSTLRKFFPEDAEAWIESELLWFQRPKAA